MKKSTFILLLAIVFSYPHNSHAHMDTAKKNQEKTKTALLHVQEKIKALESTLYQQKRKEHSLLQQLSSVEKSIGEQSEKLRHIANKKQTHQAALKKLEKERSHLQVAHQKQLQALSTLARSSFQHQQKERLELLLEPEKMPLLARMNEYYKYFYQARTEHLNAIKKDLVQLQTVEASILQEEKVLNVLQEKIKEEHSILQVKQARRQVLLNSLSSESSEAKNALLQLQKQATHLNKLFATLQDTLQVTPTYIEPLQNFSKMKKQLPFPIQGISTRLSELSIKNNAKKTYIEAVEGTPVNAIFSGKVVFAEWLRGIGLLIILDHGNGYMTLYGNNQKLYKTLGDSVNQGEMIARVGQSGGHAKAGLYFEIRKDGEPLDPSAWLTQA